MSGVVFRRDNQYLHCVDTLTHTGHHQIMIWVENINLATVFYTLPSPEVRKEVKGAAKLNAVETRQVRLVTE